MDETTSLQHPRLEFLEMDKCGVYNVVRYIQLSGNASFKKYFSRIKTLQLRNILYYLTSWERGWYMMLVASQSLTTLDLRQNFRSKFSPLELVSHLRFTHSGVVLACPTDFRDAFDLVPCDLGRFPSLRHFKIQVRGDFRNVSVLRFLKKLLSKSSSTSLESLEIKIAWHNVGHGHENDLFSSEAGWPELDEILTCENFVCLKKITLSLDVRMRRRVKKHGDNGYKTELGLERNLTPLLPMFSSSSQRTLETCLVVYEYEGGNEGWW